MAAPKDQMPPLPPMKLTVADEPGRGHYYTADQMHDYARTYAADLRARVVEQDKLIEFLQQEVDLASAALVACQQEDYSQGQVDGVLDEDARAQAGSELPEPEWIVNDLGELGVKLGDRFFFLYKGDNLEYGLTTDGEFVLHDDGTPMLYRIVGKREFGEVCYPASVYKTGHIPHRYTVGLVYRPGLSFGKPEDAAWKPLPAAKPKEEK